MHTRKSTLPPKIIALGIRDDGVRAAITFALEARGYAIRTCALDTGLRPQELVGDADCLVLDCEERGRDFPEALARWWSVELGRPAIVLASTPSLALLRTCVELGAQVVEKPLLGEALLVAIDRQTGLQPTYR